jgi:anti-sigma regulatory factor (Ser/Thr protein kinase)
VRELSLHILDLARNGLEAGASLVTIEIEESPDHDRLQIIIADNGHGMDEPTLARAGDPFYTTRTTRRVGMGISLFDATCVRCEGEVHLQSAPGAGTRVEAFLALSHLDRPPLGDMGGVIAALACESRGVQLHYTHTTATGRFELDTGQVRAEFGKGAFSNPTVLLWLGEYVREGIRAAGSQA